MIREREIILLGVIWEGYKVVRENIIRKKIREYIKLVGIISIILIIKKEELIGYILIIIEISAIIIIFYITIIIYEGGISEEKKKYIRKIWTIIIIKIIYIIKNQTINIKDKREKFSNDEILGVIVEIYEKEKEKIIIIGGILILILKLISKIINEKSNRTIWDRGDTKNKK